MQGERRKGLRTEGRKDGLMDERTEGEMEDNDDDNM